MFEELLDENEVNTVAVFPKIFIGKTVDFDYSKVTYIIDNFSQLSPNEVKEYVLDLANKKEITVQSSN